MRPNVMSPDAPAQETAGMEEANRFFIGHPQLGPEMCKVVGEGYFKRMAHKNEAKANGFRTWAYHVAMLRAK